MRNSKLNLILLLNFNTFLFLFPAKSFIVKDVPAMGAVTMDNATDTFDFSIKGQISLSSLFFLISKQKTDMCFIYIFHL